MAEYTYWYVEGIGYLKSNITDPVKAVAFLAECCESEPSEIIQITEDEYLMHSPEEPTDNNIMTVKSGEPRTELQQAYDYIALLEAKIENQELLLNGGVNNANSES